MTDESRPPEGREPGEVLTALPRSRPHRRSSKRQPTANGGQLSNGQAGEPDAAASTSTIPKPARPRRRAATPSRLRQPPQPRGLPPKPESAPSAPPEPESSSGSDILSTAVQAAAELTEIGLTLSARMLRRAVSRLPRP